MSTTSWQYPHRRAGFFGVPRDVLPLAFPLSFSQHAARLCIQSQGFVNMLDAKWFRGKLKDRRLTQRALANQLGIDPAQVTNLFKGRRRMRLDEASVIAQFLNTTVEDVLTHAGLPVQSDGKRPILLAGYVDDVGEVHIEKGAEAHVIAPAALDPGTLAVRSRAPDMLRGALLFFKPAEIVDAAAIGRLAAVRLSQGPWLIRTVQPGVEAGMFDLYWPTTLIEGARLTAAVPVLWIKP